MPLSLLIKQIGRSQALDKLFSRLLGRRLRFCVGWDFGYNFCFCCKRELSHARLLSKVFSNVRLLRVFPLISQLDLVLEFLESLFDLLQLFLPGLECDLRLMHFRWCLNRQALNILLSDLVWRLVWLEKRHSLYSFLHLKIYFIFNSIWSTVDWYFTKKVFSDSAGLLAWSVVSKPSNNRRRLCKIITIFGFIISGHKSVFDACFWWVLQWV